MEIGLLNRDSLSLRQASQYIFSVLNEIGQFFGTLLLSKCGGNCLAWDFRALRTSDFRLVFRRGFSRFSLICFFILFRSSASCFSSERYLKSYIVRILRTPWLAILGDFREFSISGDAKKSCTIVFGWSKSFCFHVRKSDYVIPYYVIANFVFQKTTYFTIPPAQKG